MKKINFQPSFLQILYLIIFIILFAFLIYTPALIKGPVSLTPKLILEEETFEGVLICILFIISILILNLYRYEVNKQKEMVININAEKKKVEERLNIS
jgi:cell shape-determining protein MreD